MKFKTIDQYHQQSECKRYTITHAKDHSVRSGVVFTLASHGAILDQTRCDDIASERALAVRELREFAAEHARQA
jgi:hypothetical protein